MAWSNIPDMPPPDEAAFDAVDAAEIGAVAIAEAALPMLARIAEVGMRMIEAMAARVAEEPGSVIAEAEVFGKVSHAVRRTIALQVKLARDAARDRAHQRVEQPQRRREAHAAHKTAKDLAIWSTMGDAYFGSRPEGEEFNPNDPVFDRLFDVHGDSLADTDEFRDYLNRPVGETVARLCAVVGIDPGMCAQVDGAWKLRCAPLGIEQPDFPPSPSGEGGSAHSAETGGEWGSVNDSG